MKCRIMEKKKASSFTFRAHSPRSKQLAGEGLRAHRNRLPKNKHNPLCTDTCGRYRASGSSIRRDFPRGGARDGRGKRVERRKDRSPRRFSGSIARDMQSSRETRRRPSFHRPLRLRLPFSFPPPQKFLLALPTFRYCVGGVGALLATIFARRKPLFQPRLSWIAAPAGVNEWRRGDRPGNVATEPREKGARNAGKRIAPRRRFRPR